MSRQTDWLLEGEIAIQYLTYRDLLHASKEQCDALQARLSQQGICARLLSCQRADGHWGLHYYQPKWTSTHYTLLQLKDIGAPPALDACRRIILRMFDECMLPSGSMNLSKHDHPGDTCVDGMVLNYSSYFCPEEARLDRLAAHTLSEQKLDGGFTWDTNSNHGDPHTTICVLEGLAQYAASRASGDKLAVANAMQDGVAFLLANNLFLDGADRRFTKLTYPARYRYDVLRAQAFFAREKVSFDERMRPALMWLSGKRTQEGLWRLEHVHAGAVHFELEEVGKPSHFITLKAMVILDAYGRDFPNTLDSTLA
jgi:hypothetical protein